MNNKVKFNICNCHYALQRVAEDGEMTFDVPVAMPGAVSLALDPNGEPESFYADGIEYYIIANNMGYDGDLELALIPESFRTDVLKEEADGNEVLVESREVQTETLTVKARPLASGYVKAKTGNKTSAETYEGWYKSVYLPVPRAEAGGGVEEEGQG